MMQEVAPSPSSSPPRGELRVRGNEHPNFPSKKGWKAKPDGVVADTPLKEGNELRYS